MRIKICRKEAKESAYWLKLIDATKAESETVVDADYEVIDDAE